MKKKSKILSLLLAMALLLSMCAIPVQAADTLQNQTKKVVMVVGQKTTIKTGCKFASSTALHFLQYKKFLPLAFHQSMQAKPQRGST